MCASRPSSLALAALVLGACASTSDAPASGAAGADADLLAAWMSGVFTSAAQAAERPDDYFDIHLSTAPIWTGRADGAWLYVEQAAAESLERPYRQRVYHLVDVPGGVRSDVYLLPGDPLAFAGAWRDPSAFDAFGPADLALRAGCAIHLAREGVAFAGATRGTDCASALGSASYATSEVRVEPDVLTSWDRGWDAGGVQAWGAVAGPYVFERASE